MLSLDNVKNYFAEKQSCMTLQVGGSPCKKFGWGLLRARIWPKNDFEENNLYSWNGTKTIHAIP